MSERATTRKLAAKGFGEAVCESCMCNDGAIHCFVKGVDEYEYSPLDGCTTKTWVPCLPRNSKGNCKHFKEK